MRHKIITTVHLILTNKNNEILLLKRQNTGYEDGSFSLVAGHVEKDETILQAVLREAKEEIGVYLNPKKVKFTSVLHRRKENSVDNDHLDFFFTYTNFDGKISNNEREKCESYNWFKISELPKKTIPFMEVVLKKKPKKFYLEYGWNQ